jgi:energy-coupling factor transporter ATP-binding protein EcfA2
MKSTLSVVILVSLFLGMALTVLFLFFLRKKRHEKLNRVIGASNQFGDQTRYLKIGACLYVQPIIGLDISPHLKTLSAHFLSNGEQYRFALPAGSIMATLGFRFCCVKSLSPIPEPRKSKKSLKSPLVPLGKTLNGKEVNLTLENTSLCLIVGAMGSGKSRLGYRVLDILSNKTWQKIIYIVDITSTFPRRICEKANAKRITTHQNLLGLAKELTKENEQRQELLNRFDIDHYKNLPKEHGVFPIFIVIDEAHSLFDSSQDFKSEKGKLVLEAAKLLNEIILTGRKTGFCILNLSISALKSENLIRIGKASTILSGYLAPSESEALLKDSSASNPALTGGVFIIKSPEFLEPTIFQSYHYDDSELKTPKEMPEEEEKPPTGIEPNPEAVALRQKGERGDGDK